MKTDNSNIVIAILITSVISGSILTSNTVAFATVASHDSVIMHIDTAISAIKNGDTEQGKKHLLKAEALLEGVETAVDPEKRIEAALKALKDGNSNGSISQAEEAKNLLNT
jgi:hypothetical protein